MAASNPLDGYTVDPSTIRYVGRELQRPECILAEPDGTLWAADARGGVTRIAPDGSQRYIGQRADTRFGDGAGDAGAAVQARYTQGTLPNGLAFAADGSILISNFGTDRLEIMDRDGRTRTLIDNIDGQPIGKVNFVLRDTRDRVWLTVSTRVNPWTGAGRPRARRLRRGARRWPHPRGGRRISLHQRNPARRPRAMAVHRGNHRPAHHPHAAGRVPARRSQAGRPRDLRPRPPGRPARRHRVRRARQSVGHADHGGPAYRAHAPGRHAFAAGRRRRRGQRQPDAALRARCAARTCSARGAIAPWMASITFGGPDLRTVYLGSLFGTRIPCFRSPVPGLPMAHWPRAGR